MGPADEPATCATCGLVLDRYDPSPYWCGESCQAIWIASHHSYPNRRPRYRGDSLAHVMAALRAVRWGGG